LAISAIVVMTAIVRNRLRPQPAVELCLRATACTQPLAPYGSLW
jgi:hypothetical protein